MSHPQGIDASLESVLSTAELEARPSRPPNYEVENRALLAIAQHMADSPRTTLQKLVEVALEVCRAGSAGVSLLHEESCEFYWPAIAGAWKSHIGGGTFTQHERPPIEEALSTPFYVEGKAVGTLWVVAHDETRKFDAEDLRLIESLGRFAAASYPVWTAMDVQETQSQLRDMNERLLVSSVRQHELTEQAQKAETALRESEERLELELAATKRLQETSTRLMEEDNAEVLYEQILAAAEAIMHSDMSSMQVLDEGEDALRMLAFRGFDPEFGQIFKLNRPDTQTSCSAARREGQRVIVSDVETCDYIIGTPALEAHRKTGIRAVQSTPLISRGGKLLGMISTHWRRPYHPPERDLRLLDVLARLAADLIERSQAEDALQNLNTDLKHFSYAASHDLQEPLRMVMSYTQLLARNYKGRLDPQADQFIDFAVDGAKRMEALLRDLREYWSVNERKIENLIPIDCERIFEKAVLYLDSSIRESGATITHDSLPTVMAEAFPLILLFQNLIGNSIKYHRPEAPPRIHLSAQRSGAAWRISVADNGIGIEAKHLKTIFAPFKRLFGREYPGTGLGLAMCQKIVERYRGRIWVESIYGQGSTFYFTLPALGSET